MEVHFIELPKFIEEHSNKYDPLSKWLNFWVNPEKEELEVKALSRKLFGIMQLTKKFGEVPDLYVDKLGKLTPDKMDELALEIFDMKSIDEINKFL